MRKQPLRVAIALIVQQAKVLIGWRDAALHQGGCYQFAGGKVEANETPEQAVQREVLEEVGMTVQVLRLFEEISFEYPDRAVQLYFYLCQPLSHEMQQGWQWVDVDRLDTFEFPAANQSIIQRLSWARHIAITTATQRLNVKSGMGLCYLRHRTTLGEDIAQLHQQNIHVIVPVQDYLNLNPHIQKMVFAVHLNSAQLQQYSSLEMLQGKNVIAACHHVADIQQANMLGCDAIFLSPVHRTSTHPERDGMGWEQFQQLAMQANMPVYALGGIGQQELETAQCYGAYGIAGISDFW